MNQDESPSDETLEPPGTIAVIGGGPLGLEAALYGRFLGYNVTLIEAAAIGNTFQDHRDDPLPMLPDRCLSPLALSALNAQDPEAPPLVLPTTVGQWIDDVMVALTHTDLLRGRVRLPARVTSISHLEIQRDEEDQPDDELPPPDFRVEIDGGDTIDAEAVIVAIGDAAEIDTSFDVPCPYFFNLGQSPSGDAERDLLLGLKRIVDVYARLADRDTLDLYRPVRGEPMIHPEANDDVDDEDPEDIVDETVDT